MFKVEEDEKFSHRNILHISVALGEKLKNRFEQWRGKYDIVDEIRGLGAILAFTLVNGRNREPADDMAKELVTYCAENGLILLACGMYGNVIRTLVPFVI